MSELLTNVEDRQYKLVDESYEDDYGSHKSNFVVYSRKLNETKWQRESPATYNLSRMDAEGFIPRYIKTYSECGHVTHLPIKYL